MVISERDELVRTIDVLEDSIRRDRNELYATHHLTVSKRHDLHCRIDASFKDLANLLVRLNKLDAEVDIPDRSPSFESATASLRVRSLARAAQ